MENEKKKNDLDVFVYLAFGYIAIWSLLFFIAWCVYQIEPSTLEACILAPGVIELICTAYIQSHKPKKDDKEEIEPELPVEEEGYLDE